MQFVCHKKKVDMFKSSAKRKGVVIWVTTPSGEHK
jgi:hypothetical protein